MTIKNVQRESFDEDRVKGVLNVMLRRRNPDDEAIIQFQRDLDLVILEIRARVVGIDIDKRGCLMNAISNVMDGWFNNYRRKRLYKSYEKCMEEQGLKPCLFDQFRVTIGRDETLTSTAIRFEKLMSAGINVGSKVINADGRGSKRARKILKITQEAFLVFEDEPKSEYSNVHVFELVAK